MGAIKEFDDMISKNRVFKVFISTLVIILLISLVIWVIAMAYFTIRNGRNGHSVKVAGVELPEIPDSIKAKNLDNSLKNLDSLKSDVKTLPFDSPKNKSIVTSHPSSKRSVNQNNKSGKNENNENSGTNNGNIGGKGNTTKNHTVNGTNNGVNGDVTNNIELQLTDSIKDLVIGAIEHVRAEFGIENKVVNVILTSNSNAGKIVLKLKEYLISKGYSIGMEGIIWGDVRGVSSQTGKYMINPKTDPVPTGVCVAIILGVFD